MLSRFCVALAHENRIEEKRTINIIIYYYIIKIKLGIDI